MTRRDRRHQRAGGCRDAGLTVRLEELHGPTVRTGPDVRLGLDVAAAASDAARVSGGESHDTHTSDCSSLSHSPSAGTAALRT